MVNLTSTNHRDFVIENISVTSSPDQLPLSYQFLTAIEAISLKQTVSSKAQKIFPLYVYLYAIKEEFALKPI